MPPTDTSSLLNDWAHHLQRSGAAAWIVVLLEAFAPLQPLGEALFIGGRFLLSPWASPAHLQAVETLLTDEDARSTFLHTLRTPGAAP